MLGWWPFEPWVGERVLLEWWPWYSWSSCSFWKKEDLRRIDSSSHLRIIQITFNLLLAHGYSPHYFECEHFSLHKIDLKAFLCVNTRRYHPINQNQIDHFSKRGPRLTIGKWRSLDLWSNFTSSPPSLISVHSLTYTYSLSISYIWSFAPLHLQSKQQPTRALRRWSSRRSSRRRGEWRDVWEEEEPPDTRKNQRSTTRLV